MKDIIILKSPDQKAIVKIEKGELINYQFNKEELMHQKGSPGWENTDTEMFPVIGSTFANKNIVSTKKGNAIQDQHGFLRELNYQLLEHSSVKSVYVKNYKANTKIKNNRFPESSREEFVYWAFDFVFKKSFELSNKSLKITFELTSDEGMPFMLGYHPAFKLSGDKTEYCLVSGKNVSIQEVIDKGGPSFPFFDLEEISLIKEQGYNVKVKASGFENMMLWTEFNNMICIEPITQYPDLEKQKYSEKNLRISTGKEKFITEIIPFK